MGIGNLIRGQLIDIIEWQEDSREVIVQRYENNGKQIMMGAQLTVRPSQVAVLVNEGQIADIYQPGRYELTTQNMPVLTLLKGWKYGFNSPFKVDVFFVNMHQFVDVKWGTSNPVMMRDADFGVIRLRAFGVFTFRVENAETLIKEVSGTGACFAVEDIAGQLRRNIVSVLSDTLAESKVAALDLAAQYSELGEQACARMQAHFSPFGLKLTALTIENISLPQEVEQALDTRTSMGVLGNMQQYTQYQAAGAIRDFANNPSGGGVAGMGAALGVGQVMGNVLGGMAQQQSAAPQSAGIPCVSCRQDIPEGSVFCPKCGVKQGAFCAKCGQPVPGGSAFCPSCGQQQ